jgi:hypothetical protein
VRIGSIASEIVLDDDVEALTHGLARQIASGRRIPLVVHPGDLDLQPSGSALRVDLLGGERHALVVPVTQRRELSALRADERDAKRLARRGRVAAARLASARRNQGAAQDDKHRRDELRTPM